MRLLEDLADMFREDPDRVEPKWLHEEREAGVRESTEAQDPSRYGEEYRAAVKARILGDPEPMKRFRERFRLKREGVVRTFTRVVGER